MPPNQEALQANQERYRRRRFWKLMVDKTLKVIASLVLPLTLGIFTVFITLHQQKLATKQRAEDRELARSQRMEDQRELQLQRKQEWDIATRQYEADNKAAREKYQDEILTSYFKEIGELIEKSNGSLMFTDATAVLARVKTLNILRQLDGSRNKHVIRFLYEAKQLSIEKNYSPLDLAGADLIDIDFTHPKLKISLEHFSLEGVFMKNCSFQKVFVDYANFYNTIMENMDFSFTKFNEVDFAFVEIEDINFEDAHLISVDFSNSILDDINFSNAETDDVDFSDMQMQDVSFMFGLVLDVEFSSADLHLVYFTDSGISEVNFASAEIDEVDFVRAIIGSSDFSDAVFTCVNFTSAVIEDGVFSHAIIAETEFSFTSIKNTDFSSAWFDSVDFNNANIFHTDFTESRCVMANFEYSDLSMSVFWRSNLKGAVFNSATLAGVDFSLANLQEADFTNTTVTDNQLWSALSIRNALLPNGTLGHARNLLKNGYVDCNSNLSSTWQVDNKSVVIITPDKDLKGCHFAVKSHAIGANISQRITLTNVWDFEYWTYSQAILSGRMTSGVTIQLNGLNKKGEILENKILDSTEKNITMILHKDMHELEVIIRFMAQLHSNNLQDSWCDDVELFIDYDMIDFNYED